MTREEAIIEAGIEYSIQNSPYCIGGDNFYEKARELNRNKSFEAGVIWADKNPKSPWISVEDDLPCNHSDLVLTYNGTPFSTKRVLVMTDIRTLFLCEMKKDDDRGWIWNYPTKDKITHWFPIPELPKEKEIKTMERKIGEIFEFEGVKLQAVKKNKSRGLCIDYYNDEVGYFGSDKDYNEFGTIGADDCDASSTPLKDKLFNLLVWVRKNYVNR